jgi:hypothetical protein
MDQILKADAKTIKDQMETEKKERAAKRKADPEICGQEICGRRFVARRDANFAGSSEPASAGNSCSDTDTFRIRES